MDMLFIDRNGLEPLSGAWLVCSVINTYLNCSFLDICLSLWVTAYESINVRRCSTPEAFAFSFDK